MQFITCGSGGTGRHTILRGWRRKAWGFKSPLPHHRSDSRYRLPVSDCGGFAAERKEWRPGRGFRRTGQPDSVWSAGRGFGSFPGDDLVRDYFHAYVDYAFDFCRAAHGAHIRAFGSEVNADEITARTSHNAFCAAGRSAEPGADTEIETRP